MTELVPTQADRVAAAALIKAAPLADNPDIILHGGADDGGFVQAFAAHAQATRAKALEEAARVADGHVVDTDLHEPISAFDAGCSWRAKLIATAIRHLIKGGE